MAGPVKTGRRGPGVPGYRRGRVPREVRLSQVLGLAEELFAERGYSATSMDELARRAGISKPMVYELVGSKEELFGACVDRSAAHLADRITAAVSVENEPRARLLTGASAWFAFVAENRDLWSALLGGIDAPIGEQANRIRARQARLVAELLVEHGAGAPQPSPVVLDALSHLVNGAFESLGRWWCAHPDVEPRLLAELCTEALFPGLMAIGAQSPPLTHGG